MNPWNIPRDKFLGIFRGTRSSEFSEGPVPRNILRAPFLGNSRWKFRGTFRRNFRGLDHRKVHRNIPRKFSLGIFRGAFRRTGGPRSFLGISSENSEGFPRKNEFPMSYFRELVSSVCRRNNVILTTYRRFFLSVCRCFLVVYFI